MMKAEDRIDELAEQFETKVQQAINEETGR